MSAVHDGRAAAARALGADGEESKSIEPWSWLAFAILGAAIVGLGILGARPGGKLPIWIWLHGRFLLVASALVLLLVGGGWSLRHRPCLQRRRGRAFLALVLVIGLLPFPMPYPSSFELHPSGVPFELPVEGEWQVHAAGGPLAAFTADRRYALHLVKPEDLTRAGAPTSPESWAAYDAPIYAPAAGTVAWTRGDLPDRGMNEAAGGDTPELGNVVVIEVAEGQHLFLGHLRAGSLTVAAGDTVEQGQLIGRLGFSGRFRITPLAHLSIHLQAGPEEAWAEPVPWTLRHYVADGVAVPRGTPGEGQLVARDAGAPE
jgi:Peptidase family M23